MGMFHVKHSLLLQKLAGCKIDGIDMLELLVSVLRGIGDGERVVYNERAVFLGNAVAAVDIANRALFLRGGVDRLLCIGNDGLRKLVKYRVHRRGRIRAFQRQMGQGIGAADDFLKVGLDPLRLVEPAGFQTVRRVILIWRDVNDIFLRLFRFCRGFRLDQLFPDGLGRFFLLRGRDAGKP